MTQPSYNFRASRYVIGSLCLLTACAILIATLWPFHVPKNQVSWVQGEDAVLIGRTGTLLSSGGFRFSNSDGPACSLEVWFEPANIWSRETVLTFYDPSNGTFSIRQDNGMIILQLGNRDETNRNRFREMVVGGFFGKPRIFLTVTADEQQTAIYVNGQLVAENIGFGLSAQDLSGQLILANSPLRNNSWSGKLRGMAIYTGILSPSEVAQAYRDWTEGRQSTLAFNRKPIAFYTFREHGGRIVHDAGTSGIDLYIPERFLVVDQLLLEPPWSEIYADPSYVRDCIINVEGFIPLGFLLTTHLALIRHMKRPAVAAIIVGGSLSALIEILQAYLPTRFSGCTDIITNSLGTALGAALYCRFATSVKKQLAISHRRQSGGRRGDN